MLHISAVRAVCHSERLVVRTENTTSIGITRCRALTWQDIDITLVVTVVEHNNIVDYT